MQAPELPASWAGAGPVAQLGKLRHREGCWSEPEDEVRVLQTQYALSCPMSLQVLWPPAATRPDLVAPRDDSPLCGR